MALNLDKKMLTGFSREVQSYLPEIRQGIANFRRNTMQPGGLAGALQHIHTIKGAAAMLGLSALSQAAARIESTLEEVVAGQLSIVSAQVEWLLLTVGQIEQYMAGLLSGNAPEQTIVTEVEQLLRAFKSQPEGAVTVIAEGNVTAQPLTSPAASTAAAADAIDSDEAPALLMDAALALSLDAPDDVAAESAATVTEVPSPAAEASLPAAAAPSLPIEAVDVTAATASTVEDDFTVDLLLDTTVVAPAETDTVCTAPAADLQTATPAADVPTAPTEVTPVSDAAIIPPEDAAVASADETSTAPAFPEDTALPPTQAALEDADDFASDLRVGSPELGLAAVVPPQDEPADMRAADTSDSTAELPAETGDTSEPLAHTPGALDALVATIDDEIQRVYTTAAMSTVRQRTVDGESMLERYLLFTLHGLLYAVAVPQVLEVGRLPAITPVPNVPAWLRGVVNLRGEILSVIDVRTFLGLEEGHYTESSRMLVVKTLGEEMTTSLVVDQVKGFVQLPKTSVQTPAAPAEDKVAPYLAGVCEYADQTLAVFDLERLLRSPEVRQFE
jgi:purine-binding chemotaxis protein CheW